VSRAGDSDRGSDEEGARPLAAARLEVPPPACGGERRSVAVGFVAAVPVRWSDIDMYQHVNHATMVTILEEARVPFLSHAFGADITSIGLLIADVRVTYKGQLRLADSPLQVTMWVKRLRAVDFTLGYEVRSVNADRESKPAVIAESQLAAFHIDEQRLVRLSPHHREYLQRWLR
jgi:acyl-CoA thioester hydrolase